MSIAQVFSLILSVSMGLVVLGLALHASVRDATYLLRQSGLLGRSVLAMNGIMLVVAIVVVLVLDLHPAIKIAIVALALSPVPPILPSTQAKAKGTAAYAISLLVTMATISIIVVPVGTLVLGAVIGIDSWVSVRAVMPVILTTIVAPLAIGLAIRHTMPEFAGRHARVVTIIGLVVLVAALVPILLAAWGTVVSMLGDGTLVVLATFAVAGLAVGHWLGGPDPNNRSVLALATATRHPGIALAIGTTLFPDQHGVVAVVFLHLVVSAIVGVPYVKWRRRAYDREHPPAKPAETLWRRG